MTTTRVNPIAARPFALRFRPNTPNSVIEEMVQRANDVVVHDVGGFCYFPNEPVQAEHNGHECLAVHLHADQAGWERFRRRGVSIVPATADMAEVETAPAVRKSVGDLCGIAAGC